MIHNELLGDTLLSCKSEFDTYLALLCSASAMSVGPLLYRNTHYGMTRDGDHFTSGTLLPVNAAAPDRVVRATARTRRGHRPHRPRFYRPAIFQQVKVFA